MDGYTRRLPPDARERVERQRSSGVAGSLLSAPAAAALRSTGLETGGEVMGCIVMHLGWSGFGCDRASGYGWGGNWGSGLPSMVMGMEPFVNARYHAYDEALIRMTSEAGALGADGVLGVTMTWSRLDTGARELVALGTAVRWRDRERSTGGRTWPFATELSAESVAAALTAGWEPRGIAIGIAAAIRHRDWNTQWQTSSGWLGNTANQEIDGLTQLVGSVRHRARDELTARASRFADAAQVVVSSTWLDLHERECPTAENAQDDIAESGVIGTVLARVRREHRDVPRSSLTVMPLDRSTSRRL